MKKIRGDGSIWEGIKKCTLWWNIQSYAKYEKISLKYGVVGLFKLSQTSGLF